MSLPTGARQAAKLGVFALAMINIAAIVSPRTLPLMAEYGWSMLFFFAASILFFLIPVSLTSAELGTGWPQAGGVYAWVREAFGDRTGFLAVWCEYSENIFWFPTALSFIAAAFAYVIEPSLASNRWFLVAVMLTVFWIVTWVNRRGVHASSLLGSVGTIVGSILPIVLIVVLGLAFLAGGDSGSAIPFSADALVPDLHVGNLVFMGGIILMYAGMEMAGFHAREMGNPARDYPRAILVAVVVIVAATVLGSLSLAWVVPQAKISLVSGVMQAYEVVLREFHLGALIRPIALLVFVGGVAHITPWILGPARGLARVAQEGNLPPVIGEENASGVPARQMVLQGIGVSFFSLVFVLVPSVSTSYWILTALTAQTTIVMYVLMFAAVIRLRYSQPDTERPFRVPGGRLGVWMVAGVGIGGSVFALVMGFLPPDQLKTGNATIYVGGILAAFLVMMLPPFIAPLFRKPSWRTATDDVH